MAESEPDPVPDVTEARHLFPASGELAQTYHRVIDAWTQDGLDFARGEQAANQARVLAARVMGADPADVALIPSVSSAA